MIFHSFVSLPGFCHAYRVYPFWVYLQPYVTAGIQRNSSWSLMKLHYLGGIHNLFLKTFKRKSTYFRMILFILTKMQEMIHVYYKKTLQRGCKNFNSSITEIDQVYFTVSNEQRNIQQDIHGIEICLVNTFRKYKSFSRSCHEVNVYNSFLSLGISSMSYKRDGGKFFPFFQSSKVNMCS